MTKSHSFYNIERLKAYLTEYGFEVKAKPEFLIGQQSLFWILADIGKLEA